MLGGHYLEKGRFPADFYSPSSLANSSGVSVIDSSGEHSAMTVILAYKC